MRGSSLILATLFVVGCATNPAPEDTSGSVLPPKEPPTPIVEVAPPPSAKDTERWNQLLDFTRKSIANDETPGAGLAIVLDGKLAFSGGVGVKSLKSKEPVTDKTVFRVGSMSKMITAAAVLSLSDAKKLRLADQAIVHVPDFGLRPPNDPASITVAQLLFHIAAMPDDFEWTCPTGPGALRTWFQTHKDYPLWAPPGTFFNYSNVGYSLAGLVAEMADGRPFADVVGKRVFEPAGMTTATFDVKAAAAIDHASLHSFQDETGAMTSTIQEHAITEYDCAYGAPAGNVIASAADFGHFAETLYAGGRTMLEPATNATMLRGQVSALGISDGAEDAMYGFGLLVHHDYKGMTLIEHGGGYLGSFSSMYMVPSKKFAAVCLSNGEGDPSAYCAKATELFLELIDSPASTKAPNASTLALYAGTYDDPNGYLGTIQVTAQGNTLSIAVPAFEVTGPVEPTGGSSFYFPDPNAYGLTGSFFPNDGTPPQYFVTRSGVAVRR